MKVLIVGSGGREHAIATAVAKSPKVDKIYCAPGNAGIGQVAECVNIGAMEFDKLVDFAKEKETSCVMCHEENELKKQQKTAIITVDDNNLITSYEEKPQEPKGNLAVPPFYCYRSEDVKRIQEALDNGCGYDAPGSFAAWLSKQTPMHAYRMPGKRYDIGDINSYEYVKSVFSK